MGFMVILWRIYETSVILREYGISDGISGAFQGVSGRFRGFRRSQHACNYSAFGPSAPMSCTFDAVHSK